MKSTLGGILTATVVLLFGLVDAYAGQVFLTFKNNSAKTIFLDAYPICTNCVPSPYSTSIASGATGAVTILTNAGVSSISFEVDYSARFGPNFTEKGCRAAVTFNVDANGNITSPTVLFSWASYVSLASCIYSGGPQFVSGTGNAKWDLTYFAN